MRHKKEKKKKKKKKKQDDKEKSEKSAKARKKLLKQRSKKRKLEEESEEESEEEGESPKKTQKRSKKKSRKAIKSPIKPPVSTEFKEDLENAAVFKVELYNRVSSPNLQVLDGDRWRYASVHVHKKDSHVVIWYGGFEYEGLGLKGNQRYKINSLPENDIFTGDNAQLVDGDGDIIECRRGPPKPLPTFVVDMYTKVSAPMFQVEGVTKGTWRDCSLWQHKKNKHCKKCFFPCFSTPLTFSSPLSFSCLTIFSPSLPTTTTIFEQ